MRGGGDEEIIFTSYLISTVLLQIQSVDTLLPEVWTLSLIHDNILGLEFCRLFVGRQIAGGPSGLES